MITAYVILVIAVVIWKGYLAWKRGMRTYRRDLEEHDSLREYLLGNGASRRESLRPFVNHALEKGAETLECTMATVADTGSAGTVGGTVHQGRHTQEDLQDQRLDDGAGERGNHLPAPLCL